jgi:hypothetical protein
MHFSPSIYNILLYVRLGTGIFFQQIQTVLHNNFTIRLWLSLFSEEMFLRFPVFMFATL